MPVATDNESGIAVAPAGPNIEHGTLTLGHVQPNQPGSLLYHQWADKLRSGEISYEEFVDWITPIRRPNLLQRLLHSFSRSR